MKYIIILILIIVIFILWLVFRKKNTSLSALEIKEKKAEITLNNSIKADKIVTKKYEKITEKANVIKIKTKTSHDDRAYKMSRLIKRKK